MLLQQIIIDLYQMRLITLTVNLRLLECSNVLGTREQNRSDTRADVQITQSHLKLFGGTIAIVLQSTAYSLGYTGYRLYRDRLSVESMVGEGCPCNIPPPQRECTSNPRPTTWERRRGQSSKP